jgi:hypothetical protein
MPNSPSVTVDGVEDVDESRVIAAAEAMIGVFAGVGGGSEGEEEEEEEKRCCRLMAEKRESLRVRGGSRTAAGAVYGRRGDEERGIDGVEASSDTSSGDNGAGDAGSEMDPDWDECGVAFKDDVNNRTDERFDDGWKSWERAEEPRREDLLVACVGDKGGDFTDSGSRLSWNSGEATLSWDRAVWSCVGPMPTLLMDRNALEARDLRVSMFEGLAGFSGTAAVSSSPTRIICAT